MTETDPGRPPRRTFLAGMGAALAGSLAALIPTVVGAFSILDPLRRRPSAGGMVQVTKLAVLPEDGTPKKFAITADRTDAWTTHRDASIGAVYLRRTDSGVQALNVVCPHAGCFVGVRDDGGGFRCPCHKSSFGLDGQIDDPASPAPRAMDALEVEVRNDDEVWVRFQSFQTGRQEKRPLA